MRAPIHLFAEVESTNDLALAAAQSGAQNGEAWLADRQLSGRGRREINGDRRQWHSPAGENIYLSVVVRPDVEANDVPNITIAVGATIARTLHEATGADVWLKWPNDLMIADRKVAGILTEGVVGASGFQAAVVGIGVNVHTDESAIPPELEAVMTSLSIATGRHIDRLSLAFAIRDAVLEAADLLEVSGLSGVSELIERFDRCDGRTVEIDTADGPKKGTARGIAPDGSLRVEIDGRTEEMRAGEARLVTT